MPPKSASRKKLLGDLQWLQKLNAFCEELIEYVSGVPADANADDYTVMPEQTGGMLRWGCTVCIPNVDFQTDKCGVAVMHVHETAYRAFRVVGAHPALGMFRPSKSPLFFERGLGIAMSVGILQHVSFCMNSKILARGNAAWLKYGTGQEELMCTALGISVP